MLEHALNLGDFIVTKEAVNIACYGLGSCVGLFLYDRLNKISGAAHVVLADELEKGTTYNAKTAFEKLIEEIEKIGGNKDALRAKIVGGANLSNTGFNIGQKNVDTLVKLIRDNKIFMAGQDVGGSKSRTARFNTLNGDLMVSSQNTHYEI
ncbi:chemotaxis protein CheD [Marivirga sp. S37H4]|uniref:Probable chemoreceptor glutamine deamidase CheD n=1 Tax=Marivirga aurantiaca TaxID=2802615 RepID=A0A934X2N1_9BACT|nr:chemotaxis protein CheD [Marivirga aurantiaca]MBK6267255.1 chemotaxis protein CheD [Marivirga aurantiaca]